MARLTQPQRRMLDYLRDFIELHGFGPQLPDLAEALGLHRQVAWKQLVALRSKRRIAWERGSIPTVRILADG